MGTQPDGGCVQPYREFLSGPCDTGRAVSYACTCGGTRGGTSLKPPYETFPPFGAFLGCCGVWGTGRANDLRRAWTPSRPIRPRRKGVGPPRADLDPRGRTGGDGGGRCLRVGLDRPRRHGRGGGRGRRHLPHPHSPAVPDADADPEAHTDADPDPETTAEATTETDPEASAARPGPASEAPARTAAASAAPTGAAARRTPSASGARRAAGARAAETAAQTVAQAHPAPLRDAGELSAVPHRAAPAAYARRHVARRLRPAHHDARGGRGRRPAPALIPGGTSCRNGLFSPSPWRPRAPW